MNVEACSGALEVDLCEFFSCKIMERWECMRARRRARSRACRGVAAGAATVEAFVWGGRLFVRDCLNVPQILLVVLEQTETKTVTYVEPHHSDDLTTKW